MKPASGRIFRRPFTSISSAVLSYLFKLKVNPLIFAIPSNKEYACSGVKA